MTDQFVAEIRLFGSTFPPKGWAFCNGQLLPLAQNTALFSLLGTNYGGDGRSNFGLPDLRAKVVIGAGQGPSSERYLGETGGAAAVTLQPSEAPFHTHRVVAGTDAALYSAPSGTRVLGQSTPARVYGPPSGQRVQMSEQALGVAGGDLPHTNLMPYVVMNYCIALEGVFPQRP